MSTSLVERTRQYHEDIETAEKVASKLLSERAKRKPKFHPIYDHAVQETLLKIQDASRRLLDIYADNDKLRSEEIAIFGGMKRYNEAADANHKLTSDAEYQNSDDGKVVWQNFYDHLKAIKDFHQVHTTVLNGGNPLVIPEPPKDIPTLAAEAIERCNVLKLFSTEESLGRRADMESFFLEYTNLMKLRKHRENEFIQTEMARLRKKWNVKRSEEANSRNTTSTAADSPTTTTTTDKNTKPEDNLAEQEEYEIQNIQFQEIDYITYLKIFDECIPRHCKYRDPAYEKYLNGLYDYLKNFFQRTHRLNNHLKLLSHIKNQFTTAWNTGAVPSWDIPTYKMPFYCLPTDRLFTSAAILKSHTEGKKYKKALAAVQKLPPELQKKKIEESEAHDKALAALEFYIQCFKDILCAVIQRTIEHLQKKQSRTLRELKLDNQDDSDAEEQSALVLMHQPTEAKVQSDSDDDDDDGEKPVYNPLNLPLGWDGKPIPFWLYKLHGLGVEFKCEICGNYSYWGRRAFERHFQEWRHAFGMRCLKIPNTVHFKEITKIEDAVLLYEQLKKETELQTFRADQDVECEDIEGNVMSARAFEDLQRQGLL